MKLLEKMERVCSLLNLAISNGTEDQWIKRAENFGFYFRNDSFWKAKINKLTICGDRIFPTGGRAMTATPSSVSSFTEGVVRSRYEGA